MRTTTRSRAATVAAALLTGSLAGGAALASAPPALAAPSPTTAATTATTAVGGSTPIAGSSATSRQVVAAWYARFLDAGLPVDRYSGSAYWMQRLDDGEDPARVLADLRTTGEYAGASVDAVYRAYLDRRADTGAGYWVDGVTSGAFPLEWVEQNVASSPEYLRRTGTDGSGGGHRSDVTVEGWYSVVLHRLPSQGERAYWLGRFDSDSPLGVLRQLWYTPEAVTARVQAHYTRLLGRTANPGEVASWYDREVASDAAVIAAVASSPEYADRAR